jgi:4a-hydroxytetrahydrobiopterin dehydratase
MIESEIELAHRKCKPCEGGTSPMSKKEAEAMLRKVEGWEGRENKIRKVYQFKDFNESWNKVTLTLMTHAIGGLSENDFILAAKIDRM